MGVVLSGSTCLRNLFNLIESFPILEVLKDRQRGSSPLMTTSFNFFRHSYSVSMARGPVAESTEEGHRCFGVRIEVDLDDKAPSTPTFGRKDHKRLQKLVDLRTEVRGC